MISLPQIAKKIEESDAFILVGHENPDGDSFGSQIALAESLKSLGKKVSVWQPTPLGDKFSYLSSSTVKISNELPSDFEVRTLVCLDTPGFDCMAKVHSDFAENNENLFIINLDHHISNKKYGDINYVDEKASSCGEIVYDLVVEMGVQLDVNITLPIYTAISGDTGGFKYTNTTWKTHLIISEIFKSGLGEVMHEYQNDLYDTYNKDTLQLLKLVLESTAFDDKYGIIYSWITKEMLEETKTTLQEADDIIRQVSSVKNTKVAILFKEPQDKDTIKISLRAKDHITDVNKIAALFGGGGHKAASGCSFPKSLGREHVQNKVLDAVKEQVAKNYNL